MNAPRTYVNSSTPTVLLVHGAFADTSSWSGVIAELRDAGIDVMAAANPLRGVAADGAYIASIAGAIDGPVLLVGHCYGGAVITQSASQADNVVGLVYVAAFAPAEGESVLDVAARYPDTLLGPALRPATFPIGNETAVELYLATDRYREVFAADLPEGVTSVAAVAQRPVAAGAFQESPTFAAWKTLPAWFIVATADQVIHPQAQRFMAGRARAKTIEVDASHAVALSRPTDVAGHIRTAAIATRAPHDTAAEPAASPVHDHSRPRTTRVRTI
jgi:pimeloyl-ACP methyl ester carboxylesterase